MTPNHFAELARDITGLLVDLEDRYRTAYQDARPPARRAHAGPRSVGTHSDPTEHAALLLQDLLDQIANSTRTLRIDTRLLVRRLDEWGPDRTHPHPNRRCTVNDCANEPRSRGLCDKHYRRELRAERDTA